MEKLTSFEKVTLKGEIEGNFEFLTSDSISVEFQWNPEWSLKTNSGKPGKRPLSRQHEIWKSTVFEAFLKPKPGDGYCEINLALDGRWNAYSFDSVRTPQPPRESSELEVLSIQVSPGKLAAVVKGNFTSKVYQIGLFAIIETQKGEKSHWALKHNKSKPDFHDPNAFILERNAK